MEELELGDIIRKLRIERKMTQQDLMDKAYLTRSQIHYIEKNKRIPRKPTLENICFAFGISIGDLILSQYPLCSSTPNISSIEAPGATIG
ncbi:MAG: XRE family transcriptional regulator [Spirochaetia bacterium]|nr:XRE family transcriptional regulator [Spirochaetia bacterium]